MAYKVSGVPLIPQKLGMSCWFASANMVATWRQNDLQACRIGEPTPWEVPTAMKTRAADIGLSLSGMVQFAQNMSFEVVPPSVDLYKPRSPPEDHRGP